MKNTTPTTKYEAKLNLLTDNILDKFSHQHAIQTDDNGIRILEVCSLHAFTQAIGYVKYKLKDDFNVMYRGQSKNHNSLKPSLYRNANSIKMISERNRCIKNFLKSSKIDNLYINGTPEYCHEPLLQHYGLNTRWIDLVDNHWIALWFGTQNFFTTDGKSIHCELRSAKNAPESSFVYIILIATPKFRTEDNFPGLYTDSDAKLIDLRASAPSMYLRPHSQHAFLLSRNSYTNSNSTDLKDRIAGIIRIDLTLTKEWLGSGGLISSHSLFPPPFYDFGYSIFLEKRPDHTKELGTITSFYGST